MTVQGRINRWNNRSSITRPRVVCSCLYVKGLHPSTTAEELSRIFEKAGKVVDAKKLSPFTALVSFRQVRFAEEAINLFEGANVHGKTIHVDYKTDKRKQSKFSAASTRSEVKSDRNSRVDSHVSCVPVESVRSRSSSKSSSFSFDSESQRSSNLPTSDLENEYQDQEYKRGARETSRSRPSHGYRTGRGERAETHSSMQLNLDSKAVDQSVKVESKGCDHFRGRGSRRPRHYHSGMGSARKPLVIHEKENKVVVDNLKHSNTSRSSSQSSSASFGSESQSSTNLPTFGLESEYQDQGRRRGARGALRGRSSSGFRRGRGMRAKTHFSMERNLDSKAVDQSVKDEAKGCNRFRGRGSRRSHQYHGGMGSARKPLSIDGEKPKHVVGNFEHSNSSSVSSQLNELSKKCKDNNWSVFIDEPDSPDDASGSWLNCSGFDQSLEDVKDRFSPISTQQSQGKSHRRNRRRRNFDTKKSEMSNTEDRLKSMNTDLDVADRAEIDLLKPASANNIDSHSGSSSSSESERDADLQPVYIETRKMNLDKLRYMVACHMKYCLMKKAQVEISIDFNKSSLTVSGKESRVMKSIEEIMSEAEFFATIETSISNVFKMCFRSLKAGDIIEVFKASHVYAGWQLLDQTLHICSDTLQNANLALELIRGLVVECDYPENMQLIPAEINCITREPEWRSFVDELRSRYQSDFFQLQFLELDKKIKFALRSSERAQAVKKDLEDFFQPLHNLQRLVSVEEQVANLLLINKEYCLSRCSEENVSFDFDQLKSNGGCKLTSQSVKSLDSAENKLKQLISQRVTRSSDYSKPGQLVWLKSHVGKLQDINELSRTLSSTVYRKLKSPPTSAAQDQPAASHIMYRRDPTSDPTKSSPPQRPAPISPPKQNSFSVFSMFKQLFSPNLSAPETAAANAVVTAARVNLSSSAASYKMAPKFIPPTPSVTRELFDKLKVVSGDIASVQADGLVSSQGVIGSSIERKTGSRLTQGYQLVNLLRGGMISTRVSVYHLNTEHWNNSDEQLKKFVENLRSAYRALHTSKVIAIPCIGTGGLGYPVHKVAQMMIGTMLECLKTAPSAVQQVMFVLHESAADAQQAFVKELSMYTPDVVDAPLRVPTFIQTEGASVTFTGLRQEDVNKAVKRLREELDSNMTKIEWSTSPQKAAIQQLTQKEIDDIFGKAVRKGVEISFDLPKENIQLEGLKDDVNSLREEINRVLHCKSTLPLHWEQTVDNSGKCQVMVDRDSGEFERVAQKFREGCPSGTRITEILRIQNEVLHTQYQAQKNKVTRELRGDKSVLVEHSLWHGTSAESSHQICAHGFNRSFAGKNGVAYGQGTYFSTSSAYSVRYSEGVRDTYIILAKVVTGRYKLGNSDTTGKNLLAGYHSTVNSLIKPSIFVVYHDAAAYPEYVICFDKL